MKRKFLAALLALVMVFSMIPVSASADGTIYEGNDTFYYHITDSSLANMVAEKGPAGSSSDVSQVTITFNHDYSAGGQNTFVFRNGYTIALSNVSDYVQPDDIAYLTISFVDDTSVVIPQSELNWTWVETLPRRYDLRLATDDNTCTVTFYYQPGDYVDNSNWEEFRQVTVDKGTSLGDSMPVLPTEGTAHWVAWETGSNNGDGAEFTAETVVNSDLSVYARKVTNGSGSEYNVMNQDNSLLEAVLKLYVDENPDSGVTTDNVQISGISVNGSEGSTNPYYDPVSGIQGPTDNGWRDGNSYFYIFNLNAGAGLIDRNTNTRVPPDDLRSITVYATVDGDNETYTIFRSDLDVRVEDNATIKIYIQDTSEEEEVTPPAPDKDTVIELAGENAVAVKCTTNEEHEQVKYDLNEGSITVGDVVPDGEGGYTCTVTVEPDSYVTAYNTENPDHSLNPTSQTGEILLVSNGEEWTIAGVAPYVTFTVACQTEPEDETPENPTWEDVERIFKDAIKVDCVNSNATHNDGTYDALEGSYTLGTVTQSGNLYTVELTFSAEKYLSEYNNLYGNHVLTGEQKNVLTLIYRNDIWCYEGGERYPVIFSVTCEDGGEEPDSNFVTQYWVMNDLDVIEKVFSAKEPDKELAGIELGTSTGIATDGEALGNGWNNSEDKLYYIVSNGEPNGDNYVPWKEVSRLTFLYENGSNGITNLDIRVEEPDENGISKVYLLYDVRYNFNNGTTNGWKHTDSTKNWASASTYTVVTPTSPYLTPPNGDGREVELIGWSQTQHNTIFEPNAELPDHLTAGGTFTVDPNAENTNNTSLMINLYAVWAYKDTSTEPTPDPDPTPDPTPTPGPGGGDKPPYIPPVDPDDSGVSDLLNTDDHIQYLFGYPEGTFGPENNMTRAEVAQMFYNLLLDQDVTITKTFDDVPAGAWYAKAVNTLASLGVVSGVGNGDFEPERSITRAEFTSIAMKFAEGKTGGTNIFSDVKPTDWFYRAVVNSTQYGWIHGYGDGTFRPNNPITRVEVTAIVNNMLGREADVDFVTEHYDELNHFSDLAVSHWGYYHIVEATNDHDYTKPSSGENWTELN